MPLTPDMIPDPDPTPELQGRGQAPPACSQLRPAKDAPRDGTMILAAVGWPWLVPAAWCADSESWAVVTVQGEPVGDGITSMYWESDTEKPANLLGWMPWPDLPGGYVFRPENEPEESNP